MKQLNILGVQAFIGSHYHKRIFTEKELRVRVSATDIPKQKNYKPFGQELARMQKILKFFL